jgi:hypothetical protein
MGALLALLLGLPAVTITTTYVNDLLIFLDGAHRVAWGQAPSLDFRTALGPLAFYLPAAGYRLSGTIGGAMPVGMAIAVLGLAVPLAHIMASRLRPLLALPFAAFILLIAAVPINLGEGVGALSFAMFYNRLGWAALAALLVMYLPHRSTVQRALVLDAMSAASLTLFMLYMKVTYGLVALGFLTLLLFDARHRRWVLIALALVAAGGLVVEALWRGSLAHIEDLRLAGRVSGTRSVPELAQGFLRHLADYTMFAIFIVLVLRRTRSLRDLLFFGICGGPGLLIMSQNAQPWGIITIHAGAVVAAEILMRTSSDRGISVGGTETWLGPHRLSLGAGGPLLLLALLLPTIVHCTLALGLHASLASVRAGEPIGAGRLEQVRIAHLWSGTGRLSLPYIETLRDGERALQTLDAPASHVSVLDFANPFSAWLGVAPPKGDSAWLHWGRNVNERDFVPPEHLFGDVRVLMVPKWGINNIPLFELYSGHIRAAYEPVRDTEFWTVYVRPTRSGETVSAR